MVENAQFYKRFVDLYSKAKYAEPGDFCFFVSTRGRHGYLSNWLLEEHGHFGEDGILFTSAEQELMYLKANVFGPQNNEKKFYQDNS